MCKNQVKAGFPLLLQDAALLSSGRREAEHRESRSHPITADGRMCRQTNGRVVFTTSGSETLPDTENHCLTFDFNDPDTRGSYFR